MKKIILTLLTMSTLLGATAQTRKCGIDTKALVAERIAAGDKRIDMLAEMAPGFDRSILEKSGIEISAQAGQILSLSVPVEALPLMESNKEVVLYSISHPIAMPECKNTRFDTRSDSVQAGLGVDGGTAYDGKDVYIGITDWGFDYTHPNYNHIKRDNFRLLMAWDHFRSAGAPPSGFNYGQLISGRRDLLDARGDTSNLYGYGTHGTHVAGICAGRGADGRQVGQAPYANLLFCSFLLGEKAWMDGVAWMRQVAQDSAKRLVVNSSWGMYSFSTIDGTSLLSRAINAWSDEGIVFCTSGGNNGDDKFHLSHTFHNDTIRTVASWYFSSSCSGQALIMWGEKGHDFEASIHYLIDGNDVASPYISTALGDTAIYDSLLVNGSYIHYRALVEHSNPFDSLPHIQIDADILRRAELQLHVAAPEGTVHAWNVANTDNHAGNMGCEFSTANHQGFVQGDSFYGIGEPACAAKCISVAAHTADRLNADSALVLGDLAYFSSYGPLINGKQKPEISAPGVNVVSSISAWTTDYHMALDSKTVAGRRYDWAEMSGTSMSSPAVTGVVALLLQANPLLTTDQVRDIIFTTARNDTITGALVANDSMDIRWGWGKIDALRAVNKAINTVSINQVEELRTPLRVYPNPASSTVNVNTFCGERQTLEVFAADGRIVTRMPINIEATLDVSAWPRGLYILRVGSRVEKLIVK